MNSTSDFTRESLGRRFVNYAPSIVGVLYLAVMPFVSGFMWTRLSVYVVGPWGYAPLAAVSVITASLVLFIRLRHFTWSQPTISTSPSDFAKRFICRMACVFWLMLLATVLAESLVMMPFMFFQYDYLMIVLFALTVSGVFYFLYSSYLWYWRCYYEKAIIDENEARYGRTVFVSIPVFKLCGHFVLIIEDHKYELRLDASTRNKPVFNHRLLKSGEGDEIRTSFGNHWFIVGWTRRDHQTIEAIFEQVVDKFGSYDRVRNNCRHFLQFGCFDFLQVIAKWDENMLLVAPETVLVVPKMMIMVWRAMLRDLFRLVWTSLWGPEWESRLSATPSSFEDLGDHEIVFDEDGDT